MFSSKRIVDFLKHEKCETAPSTVLNYLRACEEAFLLTKVEREGLIGKRVLAVDESLRPGQTVRTIKPRKVQVEAH